MKPVFSVSPLRLGLFLLSTASSATITLWFATSDGQRLKLVLGYLVFCGLYLGFSRVSSYEREHWDHVQRKARRELRFLVGFQHLITLWIAFVAWIATALLQPVEIASLVTAFNLVAAHFFVDALIRSNRAIGHHAGPVDS